MLGRAIQRFIERVDHDKYTSECFDFRFEHCDVLFWARRYSCCHPVFVDILDLSCDAVASKTQNLGEETRKQMLIRLLSSLPIIKIDVETSKIRALGISFDEIVDDDGPTAAYQRHRDSPKSTRSAARTRESSFQRHLPW